LAPPAIAGVPTSIAAFLGEAERGPLRPRVVTSFGEYTHWFGSVFLPDRFLPYAAAGFFENGGTHLYVTRVVGAGATPASHVVGDFTATATGPGSWGKRVWLRILPSRTLDDDGHPIGFRLRFAYWAAQPATFFDPFEDLQTAPRPQHQEEFDDLSVDALSPNHFGARLTDQTTGQPLSALVSFTPTVPGLVPALPAPTEGETLDANGDDAPALVTAGDFAGSADRHIGRPLQGLELLKLDASLDVALVHAPFPPNDPDLVARALVAHCEDQRFRFAIIDSANSNPAGLRPRESIGDTQYAAFYSPWIVVADPLTGSPVTVPPGGHVAGICARTDIEHGVFKAPANEVVQGALDLAFQVDESTDPAIQAAGVNAIRRFPSRGIRVWGARTLSSDSLWKYVPMRRLFIFLEHSIQEGTRWAVFEPNGAPLWARIREAIRLFLHAQWTGGALSGRTEQEAFFIRCDGTTMTADDILNGRLICEIGVAPLRPAEFVVFRLFQHTAEPQG
jgi:phage tail sheath protein FI